MTGVMYAKMRENKVRRLLKTRTQGRSGVEAVVQSANGRTRRRELKQTTGYSRAPTSRRARVLG